LSASRPTSPATVELSFDVPSEETATGFVAVANWDPEHLFRTRVSSDEPATLGIPDSADDSVPSNPLFDAFLGDRDPFLPVVVMAATPDGTLYGGRLQLNVDDDPDRDSDNGSGDDSDGDSDDGFGPRFDAAGALGVLGYLLKRRLEPGDTPDND